MPRRFAAARAAAPLALALSLAASLAACSSDRPVASPATSAGTSGPVPTTSPTSPAPTSTAPASQSPVAVRPTPAGTTPLCTDSTLGAVETRHGTSGGHAYSVVRVVNGTKRACTLAGYPRPAFWVPGGGRLVKIPLAVTHGATVAAADQGPVRFLVPPGGLAWFSLQTGTSYGGRYRLLTYFTFYPTAKTSGVGVLCGVNLATNSPDPVPVVVTAFAPGPGPTS
jgi:Protein of unknown function (DUF4232)